MSARVIQIHVHADAPAKPAAGAACNGCGVCCLAQPCPIGMIVSRRWSGRCAVLQWEPASARYRCGLVAAPGLVLGLGRGLAARNLARLIAGLAKRWISAGSGCDSTAQVSSVPSL